MFRKILFISLLIAPGLVLANELSQEELEDLLAVKIRFARHMALNPSIVRAVEAQNSQQLALAEIKRRDDEWKNVGDEPTALIREITGNKVARYFERRVESRATRKNGPRPTTTATGSSLSVRSSSTTVPRKPRCRSAPRFYPRTKPSASWCWVSRSTT
jgi:hypothetical protein